MFKLLKRFITTYHRPGIMLARHALGKYIIGFACLLHISWAALLIIDRRAGNATPLSVLFALLGNDRVLVITVLFLVAILAAGFLDLRLRKVLNFSTLSMLLIPQQLILWCSAGAGVYATIVQHYADGVMRSWPHILADQSSIILMALLYTIALVQSRHPPLLFAAGSCIPFKPGQVLKIAGES
jgi:hypothetical protein